MVVKIKRIFPKTQIFSWLLDSQLSRNIEHHRHFYLQGFHTISLIDEEGVERVLPHFLICLDLPKFFVVSSQLVSGFWMSKPFHVIVVTIPQTHLVKQWVNADKCDVFHNSWCKVNRSESSLIIRSIQITWVSATPCQVLPSLIPPWRGLLHLSPKQPWKELFSELRFHQERSFNSHRELFPCLLWNWQQMSWCLLWFSDLSSNTHCVNDIPDSYLIKGGRECSRGHARELMKLVHQSTSQGWLESLENVLWGGAGGTEEQMMKGLFSLPCFLQVAVSLFFMLSWKRRPD